MNFIKKYSLLIIFIFLFILGLFLAKDYGVPWDEPLQQQIGKINYEYIVRQDPQFHTFYDKYYGSWFEVFLYLSQKIILKNFPFFPQNQIFFLRHFLIWIFFIFSLIFFFLINKIIFKNKTLSFLACLFLLISPRIFAHAFFNSKDIPFLSIFIIAFYFLIKYDQKKNSTNLFLFTITTALTISLRLFGLFIPLIFIIFHLVKLKLPKQKLNLNFILTLTYYLLLVTLFTYLSWPLLWQNPFSNFSQAVLKMSHYSWNKPVLFLGRLFQPDSLPFYYVPTWISITTPPFYLLLFFTGLFYILRNFKKEKYLKLSLIFFIFPLIFLILTKTTLYDGWRHVYFIYPFFIIIAIYGLKKPIQKIPLLTILFASINFFSLLIFIIKSHPHQHVYFNFLAGKNIRQKFELDYWGLSYRKGLEFLLSFQKNNKIKIVTENIAGSYNGLILSQKQIKRFEFYPKEEIDKADYFLTNYRWHPSDYPYQKIYSEKVQTTEIMGVYKLR